VELSINPRPNIPNHAIQLNSWISLIRRIKEKLKMFRTRINDKAALLPNLSRTSPIIGAATTYPKPKRTITLRA